MRPTPLGAVHCFSSIETVILRIIVGGLGSIILPMHANLALAADNKVVSPPTATLTPGDTYSSSTDGEAALTSNRNGSITGDGVTVTTSGQGAPGVWAKDGGDVALSNSTITTTGDYDFQGADGVYLQGGSTATLTNVAITTRGSNSIGVVVLSGNLVTIHGSSIVTGDPNNSSKGARSHGLEVNAWTGTASKIIANPNAQGQGLTITTYGAGANGLNAVNEGEIDVTKATIETVGVNAYGVMSGGTVTLTGGSVSTGGQGAFGLYVSPPGVGSNTSSLTATNTNVTTAGAGAHGLYMRASGRLTVSHATVSATGTGSNGLISAGGPGTTAIADLNTVSLNSAGTGVAVTGGTLDLSLANSTVTSGTGDLLSVAAGNGAAGTLTLTVDASRLAGVVSVDGAVANTAAMTLQNGSRLIGDISVDPVNGAAADMTLKDSTWQGAGSGMRKVAIDRTSTWTVTGDSSVLENINVAGTLQIGNGDTAGSLSGNIENAGSVIFNRAGTIVFDDVISGSGSVKQSGPGLTVLTGANSYTGVTTVTDGTLAINGDQSTATGLTKVDGGTLTGSGIIGGTVAVSDGGRLLVYDDNADGINKLSVNGDLTVNTGGTLHYQYGVSPGFDRDVLMVDVGGDVILNGTLSVTNDPSVTFGTGIYGLVHYNGTLDVAGLKQSLPDGFFLQTAVKGRVNIVNAAGQALEFWDPSGVPNDDEIKGGTGRWTAAAGGGANWTNASGSINGPFNDGSFAIFSGTGGTVTVDESAGQVRVSGMQFTADNYFVSGDAIALDGASARIAVGDNTLNGAAYTTTISSVLQGAAQLVKEDLGTLVLSAVNKYTGGTAIDGGTLSVSSDHNLGASAGGLSLNGTLLNTGAFSTARAITLGARGGTFETGADLTLAGKISGTGGLTKTGGSTLTLTGSNDYAGKTTIDAGTLSIGSAGNLGASSALALNGGRLLNTGPMTLTQAVTLGAKGGTFKTDADLTLAGKISGDGALTKTGDDQLTLTADNDYKGGTKISEGTLRLGDGGTSGGITGGIVNDGMLFVDRSNTLALHGDISGAGTFTQAGSGATVLSGANTYTGSTTVKAGTLAAGAAGAFSSASGYSVLSGATLDLASYDQILASLDNAGLVRLGSNPGTVLRVKGEYTGEDGALALSAALGGDNSVTDRLVVEGDTSGTAMLAVHNAGGNGAQTSEGIKIVDVEGTSGATFTLLGDYTFKGDPAVVGGAYAYRLYKNGVADPNDGDWYLRSSLEHPKPSPCPDGNQHCILPPPPHFQPGAPVYEAYGQVLLELNAVGTLRERLGNRVWQNTYPTGATAAVVEAPAPALAPAGETLRLGTVWGRIETAHGSFEPRHATSSMDYSSNTWKLQAGLDGQLYETDAGQFIGGLFVQYGTMSTDVSSPHGQGDIDSKSYGLGGTLTWFGTDGLYLDGVAQATWYDSDLTSSTASRDLVKGNDGFGYALSLEAGKEFTLTPNWSLTPQAQLVYSAIDFDAFTDTFGARVSLDTADSLKGRAGLAADYHTTWRDKHGQAASAHLYGIANLTYEILDGVAIDLAGTNFATANDRLWGGIGLGGTYSWADNTYALHAEAALDTSLDNFADSYAVTGNVGLKVRW